MIAYHLVYDILPGNPRRFRVLVAYKNVHGSRFGGDVKPRSMVLNGAGQLVIPGGKVEAADEITGGRTEFFEETGIDLRDLAVRQQMGCMRDAWFYAIDEEAKAYCVYQQVQDVMLVQRVGNDNIQGRGQLPLDEELHHMEVHDASDAWGRFRAVWPNELKSDWRGDQYRQLTRGQKDKAEQKARASYGWYRTAVEQLTKSLSTTPPAPTRT
ncbi:hypothetical protein IAG44_38185 [Streptomyces roseirectus]|uniref:Nudix hydrolase domain-containing protein n=1 Tax=Streptomyces roseirectus TaxID=2768066 RepID=A0A7H0IPJ5_9ACTN|nr:hypothetical protein [Streptomyces roseirectus]QNP74711.1 hypothetical protein IAG44_38185 [Streptomyces roseirectus]